jgi:hypothetical protein
LRRTLDGFALVALAAWLKMFHPRRNSFGWVMPLPHISRHDLNSLIATLEVSFVRLAECLVAPGWRLDLGCVDVPGIHYSISGSGRIIANNRLPIELPPHTLVILPKNTLLVLESDDAQGRIATRTGDRPEIWGMMTIGLGPVG